MKRALQDITNITNEVNEKKKKKDEDQIKKEKCYLKKQIETKLNIELLKDLIKEAHEDGENQIILLRHFLIDTDLVLYEKNILECACSTSSNHHEKEECIFMQFIEDIFYSLLDKDEFDIKMKLHGKIVSEKTNGYARVWRIYLKFEV